MKAKDLILVGLVCANVTLAALSVGLHLRTLESEALAESQSRAGDYILITGPISSTREAMLLIDTVAKRANLYVPRAGTTTSGTQWELTDTHDLAADFGRP